MKRLVFLLALAACGGDSTGATPVGSVEFTYSGAISGRYSARGGASVLRGREAVTAVRTARDTSSAVVFATDSVGDGSTREFQFAVPLAVGTYGCTAGEANCRWTAQFGVIRGGVVNASDTVYRSTTSTISVRSVTADRVRGTFSYTLNDARTSFEVVGATVRVEGGTFDAPIQRACGFGCTQ